VEAMTSTSRVKESWKVAAQQVCDETEITIGEYFEGFGQHFADFLLAEGTGALHHFAVCFALFLPPSAASTGTDGAAENFWPPPATDGTFAVVQTEDGIWVREGPRMG
jgi:hypothetical protein